ncbi:histidine kinase dimerization/phospho-acceptor domain-containing protein [Vulgatibacter incomptus]|uniref:histidine kinase n=1 Tax=Vulgatibacter incomptus TaxID=1391653 RepID=A0A0K1P9N4_9BACT|nr:histidine kinase dimerization/phospho-acceptor domain-containing protein [Vulgatibacter incomptus]AKU90207.1 hypothetical protein AKJ08_0594 [Vulgatibacter incomptus]
MRDPSISIAAPWASGAVAGILDECLADAGLDVGVLAPDGAGRLRLSSGAWVPLPSPAEWLRVASQAADRPGLAEAKRGDEIWLAAKVRYDGSGDAGTVVTSISAGDPVRLGFARSLLRAIARALGELAGRWAAVFAHARTSSREQAARRGVAERDERLAVVSHDLRNPLASIVANAGFLETLAPHDEQGQRFLRRVAAIRRASDRMGRLIGQLLETGGLPEAAPLRLLQQEALDHAQHEQERHRREVQAAER